MLPKATLLALLPFILQVDAQASGTGKTTRYWDCCKASCGWKGKATLASGSNPVGSCDAKDNLLTNYDAKSGCNSGVAYMCSNQSPWAVSETLAYGFAATTISGGKEASWCCACYELTFTSGAVAGKKMIVQATNTGGDLAANQFDIAVRSYLLFQTRTLTKPDARWRLRNFQWLHRRMGHSIRRMGCTVRRCFLPLTM